jgi:hypothetical protein
MEALMNRRSYPYEPSAEDQLVVKKWKCRMGALYGAVLLVLVLIAAAAPYTKTDIAKRGDDPAFSFVAMENSRVGR